MLKKYLIKKMLPLKPPSEQHVYWEKKKPFSDVDIIKKPSIEVVSFIHPKNISQYKELPLSRTTITSGQYELASNLKQRLNSKRSALFNSYR